MLPTVSDILDYPELKRGDPVVRAGAANLHRPVSWVHVSEVSDIAGLLGGGELILSTGIGLPEADDAVRTYVRELAGAAVSALVVELGQRFSDLPDALVTAAEECGLPLIMLQTVIPFVAVTQAVHAHILHAQMREIVASDEAHRAFNALTVAGRSPQEVVDLAATMSGRPVIYESFARHVLAFNGAGEDPDRLLTDWERRSRAAQPAGEPSRDPGWSAVPIAAAQGGTWGRLVMLSDSALTARERMILERGGTALVINRLIDRDLDHLHRETHRTLLTALALSPDLPTGAAARAGALGVPLANATLTGVVLVLSDDAETLSVRIRDLATQSAETLRTLGIAALVGSLDDHRVAILLSGPDGTRLERTLDTLAGQLRGAVRRNGDGGRLVIGVGQPGKDADGGRRSLREAMQIADSARGLSDRPYYRPADLRLRSLMVALRDDPSVKGYVERELGRLLDHDAAHGTALFESLVAFCRCGGNKTAAATVLFLSRATLYERIAKVERVLAVDLSDAETVLSLHLAIVARESMTQPGLALRPDPHGG